MTHMPNVSLRLASRLVSAVLYVLLSSLAISPLSARGAMLSENPEPNGTRLTATAIPDAAFDFANTGGLAFRNATNDPAAAPFRTVGLLGRNNTIVDVDFFSFSGIAGEKIYVDADNNEAILCPTPCSFDLDLGLYNSKGALLAFGNSSLPQDFGNGFNGDPFIGVFTLPATDTYYLAVVGGLAVQFFPGATFTDLLRPDGVKGGFAIGGSPDNQDVFGVGDAAGGYLVWVSRSGAAGSIPEPGTFSLLGLAIVAFGMARRRKKT